MIWNPFITLFIESYSILVMSAMVCVANLNWSYFGQVVDSILGICFFVVAMVGPVYGYGYMRKNLLVLDEKTVKAEIGAGYEGYHM